MTITAANQTISGYYDSVNGKVHTGQRMGQSVNITENLYFMGGRALINICKGARTLANPTASPGGPDANGYYDTSTSGTWTLDTHSPGAGNDWIKTGTYVLKWVGTCNATWSGGIEDDIGASGYPTVNRREYTVSSNTLSGDLFVVMSGGTCTHVELFHTDDEAAYNAGQLLTVDFHNEFGGIHTLRLMQMMYGSGNHFFSWSDIVPYDAVSWLYDDNNGDGSALRTCLPPQACCEIGIELDCNIWVNIPYKFADSDVTSMATEFDTYWTPSDKFIYLECGNEYWNSAAVFADQAAWTIQLTSTTVTAEITKVTEPVVTEVGHGFTTGRRIRMFFNRLDGSNVQKWPYAQGQFGFVIRLTDDTFQIADTYANAIATTPRTAIPNATKLVYKDAGDGSVGEDFSNWDKNYGDECVRVWDLCKAQLGTKQLNVGGTQTRVGGATADRTQKIYTATGLREKIDYFCLGPYFRMKDYTPTNEWYNLTNAQMLSWLQTTEADAQAVFVEKHIEQTGRYNLISYESGNEFGNDTVANGGLNQSQLETKNLSFVISDEMQAFVTYHGSALASMGYVMNGHYRTANSYTGADIISLMEHPTDTTAKQYLGFKVWLDAGGASKL